MSDDTIRHQRLHVMLCNLHDPAGWPTWASKDVAIPLRSCCWFFVCKEHRNTEKTTFFNFARKQRIRILQLIHTNTLTHTNGASKDVQVK